MLENVGPIQFQQYKRSVANTFCIVEQNNTSSYKLYFEIGKLFQQNNVLIN